MPLAVVFEDTESQEDKSFFSEIIASLSDVKFSRWAWVGVAGGVVISYYCSYTFALIFCPCWLCRDGRYLLSRDYLTLKIWDINMESKPIQTIQVSLSHAAAAAAPPLEDLYTRRGALVYVEDTAA